MQWRLTQGSMAVLSPFPAGRNKSQAIQQFVSLKALHDADDETPLPRAACRPPSPPPRRRPAPPLAHDAGQTQSPPLLAPDASVALRPAVLPSLPPPIALRPLPPRLAYSSALTPSRSASPRWIHHQSALIACAHSLPRSGLPRRRLPPPLATLLIYVAVFARAQAPSSALFLGLRKRHDDDGLRRRLGSNQSMCDIFTGSWVRDDSYPLSLRGVPESAYELSLRDLVEVPRRRRRCPPRRRRKRLGRRRGGGGGPDQVVVAGREKKVKSGKKKIIPRSTSVDGGVFLLKMFFPPSLGWRRRSSSSSKGAKVSPKPVMAEGEKRGPEKEVDTEWLERSGEKSTRDESKNNGQRRKGIGCYPFSLNKGRMRYDVGMNQENDMIVVIIFLSFIG